RSQDGCSPGHACDSRRPCLEFAERPHPSHPASARTPLTVRLNGCKFIHLQPAFSVPIIHAADAHRMRPIRGWRAITDGHPTSRADGEPSLILVPTTTAFRRFWAGAPAIFSMHYCPAKRLRATDSILARTLLANVLTSGGRAMRGTRQLIQS